MSIADNVAGAISFLESDLSSPTFTIGATSFACIPSTTERGMPLIMGGRELTVQLTLYSQASNFASPNAPPVAGQLLTLAGAQYRIATVGIDPTRTFYKLQLVSPND